MILVIDDQRLCIPPFVGGSGPGARSGAGADGIAAALLGPWTRRPALADSRDDSLLWPYDGRTGLLEAERSDMEQPMGRTRSARLEVRTTPEDRRLIDEAVAACGGGLTEFVVSNLRMAARQVLADRTEFVLDPEAQEAWEELNRRPARDLPGLREFMARPSPFADE